MQHHWAAAQPCATGHRAGNQLPLRHPLVACLPVPQTPLQGAGSGATRHRPPEEPTPITLAARKDKEGAVGCRHAIQSVQNQQLSSLQAACKPESMPLSVPAVIKLLHLPHLHANTLGQGHTVGQGHTQGLPCPATAHARCFASKGRALLLPATHDTCSHGTSPPKPSASPTRSSCHLVLVIAPVQSSRQAAVTEGQGAVGAEDTRWGITPTTLRRQQSCSAAAAAAPKQTEARHPPHIAVAATALRSARCGPRRPLPAAQRPAGFLHRLPPPSHALQDAQTGCNSAMATLSICRMGTETAPLQAAVPV